MEKRKQHIIPESYLKAWCDPATPPNHEPYIWLTLADGTNTKRKPPRKTFRETEFYTIQLNDGPRVLVIEDSFSQIEDRFARLRSEKISRTADLTPDDRALLCTFAAMMSARTKAPRRSLGQSFSEIHQMTKSLEEQFDPGGNAASRLTAVWKEYGHHFTMGHSIKFIAEALFNMYSRIFAVAQQQRFITSDHPCVWFNPEMQKWPRFYQQPGLAQQDIEITLPISPTCFAYFSWASLPQRLGLEAQSADQKLSYLPIPDGMLSEMNQRTAVHCDEFVVSSSSEMDSRWFRSDSA